MSDTEPKLGLALYSVLKSSLSIQRLEAYRLRGDSELDLLTRYHWNLYLSEALYPTLQNVEIALRNRLHNALCKRYSSYWMWNDPPLSRADDQEQIVNAEANLLANRKPADPPRMVAELTFGFWTRLLDRRFERVLWPYILNDVFPYLPATVRRRDFVSARFEAIRRLRNRVSHHEPIWKLNLIDEHDDLLGALSWLDPELEALTRSQDRFPHVHTGAFQAHLRHELERQSLALHQASAPRSSP